MRVYPRVHLSLFSRIVIGVDSRTPVVDRSCIVTQLRLGNTLRSREHYRRGGRCGLDAIDYGTPCPHSTGATQDESNVWALVLFTDKDKDGDSKPHQTIHHSLVVMHVQHDVPFLPPLVYPVSCSLLRRFRSLPITDWTYIRSRWRGTWGCKSEWSKDWTYEGLLVGSYQTQHRRVHRPVSNPTYDLLGILEYPWRRTPETERIFDGESLKTSTTF